MSISSLLFGNNGKEKETTFLQSRAPVRSVPGYLQPIVQQKICGNHAFLEAGNGKPVIFCHGLFGGIFNIDKVCEKIAENYRFIMPYLPMYDMPLLDCTVKKLGDYLYTFINDLQLTEAVVIGSSMGGGTALYYAGHTGNKLKGLVLCGSSGLSSIPLSKGYFRRKDYSFVKEATQDIFYDRSIPPDEMVQDVFSAIQSTEIVLRSIRMTKSATRQQMENELPGIHVPAMLVWGKQDPITPVKIAPRFQELLPDAELHIVDHCGHVPTQEKPWHFLEYFFDFMKKINY